MLSAQSTEVSHYSCPGLSPKFMLLTINNASLTSSIWPLGNNSQFLKSGTENAFNPSSHNLDPITDLWIYEASPWLGCNLLPVRLVLFALPQRRPHRWLWNLTTCIICKSLEWRDKPSSLYFEMPFPHCLRAELAQVFVSQAKSPTSECKGKVPRGPSRG